MPTEFHSFEDRDFLVSKGWTRAKMHSSRLTDTWTHPVHSIRNPPRVVPAADKARHFVDYYDRDGYPVLVDFEAPGFVTLTREQALRIEGRDSQDVFRKF